MKRSKRFDLNTLRLFIAVAERKSITSAATEMSLALGAASGRLKRLEQDLGTRLFLRSRKGIQLTDAGEMFLVHSRAVLDSITALEGDMTLFAKGVRARIHLLANTAGLAEHLPRPLSRFLQTHPECDVAIEERASFAIGELLAAGAAELGIAVDWAVPSSLESFGFCTDRLVIITPRQHPLARRRRASFQEVVDLEFVGLGVDSALQNHIRSQAAKLGRTTDESTRDGIGRSLPDGGSGSGDRNRTRYGGPPCDGIT
jgi:DNA-binding transcriptional LysR family regulator